MTGILCELLGTGGSAGSSGSDTSVPDGTIIYTNAESGTEWGFVVPAGIRYLDIELYGPGGGASQKTTAASKGGGGGAYCKKHVTVNTGDSIIGVMGLEGAVPGAWDTDGNDATNTTCTTFSLIAGGGKAGKIATAGAGGTASGGDTNTSGSAGSGYFGGAAAGPLGGAQQTGGTLTGNLFGGGGAGGSTGLEPGGAGASGYVKITVRTS